MTSDSPAAVAAASSGDDTPAIVAAETVDSANEDASGSDKGTAEKKEGTAAETASVSSKDDSASNNKNGTASDKRKSSGGKGLSRIFRSRSKSIDETPPTNLAIESAASADSKSVDGGDTNSGLVTPPDTPARDPESAGENNNTSNDPVRKAKSFKRIRGLLSGGGGGGGTTAEKKAKQEQKAKERAAKKAAAAEAKAKKAEEKAAKKAAAKKAGGKEAEEEDAAAAADALEDAGGDDKGLDKVPSGDEDDEASTVFNVDVDDRSLMTPSIVNTSKQIMELGEDMAGGGGGTKKTYMLKVVLLLMDPETRRFELLQLEFDSLKALVADVLKQIPVSVTEEALRKQDYMGICGKDGKLMDPDKLLSDFCAGNDVLVAIPKDMPPKDCARLARPILSDEKVVSMLLASGIDAKAWSMDKKKKSSSSSSKSRSGGTESSDATSSDSKKKSSSSSAGSLLGGSVVAVVVLAVLLQVVHIYLSAPIKPGHAVQPGVWLRKCGVLSFLPPNVAEMTAPMCDNDARMVISTDGQVTVYGAHEQVVWTLDSTGAKCSEKDDSCSQELRFHEDLTITVAGKAIHSVKTYSKDASLSPWPFAEQPKIKVVKK